ncbi:MAG TPA: hypothetical protein VH394_28570, partial [Thermoanaerobaculia bacterium]|nr:hypothetical protein [Thermoanaerobaculia bacterium]
MNPPLTQSSVADAAGRLPRAAERDSASTGRRFFGDPQRRSELIGQSMTWLCGGALAFNILLVLGILSLLAFHGLSYFWQKDLVELMLKDGTKVLGEIWEVEQTEAAADRPAQDRIRMKIGNRDIGGLDFAWIESANIASRRKPADAVLLERLEWGNFHGFMEELRDGDKVLAQGSDAVWKAFPALHETKAGQREAVEALEKGAIGDVNYDLEKLRLQRKELDFEPISAAEKQRRTEEIDRRIAEHEAD